MNSLKQFFYLTYAVVAIVVVAIIFLNINLSATFGVEGTAVFWMGVALLVLGLLTVGVIGDYIETKSLSKKINALNKENTELKARLYDGISVRGKEPTPSAPNQPGQRLAE